MTRRDGWLAAALLLVGLASPLRVAGRQVSASCDPTTIATADQRLRAGQLLAVDSLLTQCPGAGVSERARSLVLRARAKFALDETEAATALMQDVFTANPLHPVDPTWSRGFARLARNVRRDFAGSLVASVSKTAERLLEAPATVQVVTKEEIERRGYLDLEELLHDLPGFDISRGDGFIYSTVFQRGYRSIETNRTIFMIDGVEENDIFGNTAWLSRQYPLSSVSRVEIVHGPASTMYGANAFLGVINVITEDVEELTYERNHRLRGSLTRGGSSTWSADATYAAKSPNERLRGSITMRYFSSEGDDLSGLPDWDFDPNDYAGLDYDSILGIPSTDTQRLDAFSTALGSTHPDTMIVDCSAAPNLDPSCPFLVQRSAGQVVAVNATAAGRERARQSDQAALSQVLGGRSIGFSNPTRDWFGHAKLRTDDLEIGIKTWRRDESTSPWIPDVSSPGGNNGARWIPTSTSFYLQYRRTLFDKVETTLFSRYKLHGLDGESSTISLRSYATRRMGLLNLARGDSTVWAQTYNWRSNSQLRNELGLRWSPRQNLTIVGGIEGRNSSIGATTISSDQPDPERTGAPGSGVQGGGNNLRSWEIGGYSQATWTPAERLKIVLGGRVDKNDSGGDVIRNGRVAVVTPIETSNGDFVFKAIYATAYQNPSNFQRFQSFQTRVANPNLAPERANNIEASAGWSRRAGQSGTRLPELALQVAAYRASYDNLVDEVQRDAASDTTWFDNVNMIRVNGVNALGRAAWSRLTVHGNYTFTSPVANDTATSESLRVRDIASHQLNLSLDARLPASFGINVRTNYVGRRQTGVETTAKRDAGGGVQVPRATDAYGVAHAALRWRAKDFTVQMIVQNLFDRVYAHPGVRTADGRDFVTSHPQPGRRWHVRLLYAR